MGFLALTAKSTCVAVSNWACHIHICQLLKYFFLVVQNARIRGFHAVADFAMPSLLPEENYQLVALPNLFQNSHMPLRHSSAATNLHMLPPWQISFFNNNSLFCARPDSWKFCVLLPRTTCGAMSCDCNLLYQCCCISRHFLSFLSFLLFRKIRPDPGQMESERIPTIKDKPLFFRISRPLCANYLDRLDIFSWDCPYSSVPHWFHLELSIPSLRQGCPVFLCPMNWCHVGWILHARLGKTWHLSSCFGQFPNRLYCFGHLTTTHFSILRGMQAPWNEIVGLCRLLGACSHSEFNYIEPGIIMFSTSFYWARHWFSPVQWRCNTASWHFSPSMISYSRDNSSRSIHVIQHSPSQCKPCAIAYATCFHFNDYSSHCVYCSLCVPRYDQVSNLEIPFYVEPTWHSCRSSVAICTHKSFYGEEKPSTFPSHIALALVHTQIIQHQLFRFDQSPAIGTCYVSRFFLSFLS